MNRIRARLSNDWVPRGGMASWSAFYEYVKSGYVTLPFYGGWLEQPTWIIEDFTLFRELLDYHLFNEQLG